LLKQWLISGAGETPVPNSKDVEQAVNLPNYKR